MKFMGWAQVAELRMKDELVKEAKPTDATTVTLHIL